MDLEILERTKERVRMQMEKEGEEIDEEKVERLAGDLVALAEIFVDFASEKITSLKEKSGKESPKVRSTSF